MSDDDEGAPSFLDDVRVKFVEEKVCKFLQMQPQTWGEGAASQDFQTLLVDLFEKHTAVYFSKTKTGGLDAVNEVCLLPIQ